MLMYRKILLSASAFCIASGLLRGLKPGDEDFRAVRSIESTTADALARSFSSFKEKHRRSYEFGSEEYQLRYDLFSRRVAEVDRLNRRPGRIWTAGISSLSDRTDAELARMKGWSPSVRKGGEEEEDDEVENIDAAALPESSDWLHLANMKHIRDQGGCGSCWAVAASTVLSSHSEIHAANMTFSTQQLVDCVPNPNSCGGTGGCEGATVELAFQYVMMVGAQEPEEYGSYTAKDGVCNWTPTDKSTPSLSTLTNIGTNAKTWHAPSNAPGLGLGMFGWQKLQSNKAIPLMHAVHKYGPVAVALAANDVMLYSSGIFNDCNDWVVNHAVTLVGYGVEDGKKYWIIQNSWGSFWGEDGRIRLLRSDDEDDNCGMDDDPQAGIACKGEDEPVKVCGTCGVLYDSVVPRFDTSLL